MSISIKNNTHIAARIKKKLENKRKVFDVQMQEAASDIVERTTAGLDVDGFTFDEYSEAYELRREKKNYQTYPPNLTVTGNMLKALRSRVRVVGDKLEGVISWHDQTERKKARGNQNHRNFFGLSDQQVEKIKQKIREA